MNPTKTCTPRKPRGAKQQPDAFVPLHRRLFPIEQRVIARAAALEVLG